MVFFTFLRFVHLIFGFFFYFRIETNIVVLLNLILIIWGITSQIELLNQRTLTHHPSPINSHVDILAKTFLSSNGDDGVSFFYAEDIRALIFSHIMLTRMRTYLVAKGNGLAHNKLFRQRQLTWELRLVTTIFRRGGVTFQMGVFEENRICFFLFI